MKPKNAVYAAVGAPIVAARALNARLENLRGEFESRTEGLGEKAQRALEEWTNEGRQVMEKVSDGKVVDEFAAKVDFDQAREQVGKLRDQLEEMLATWRTSFRPEAPIKAPEAAKPASKAEKAQDEKASAGTAPKAAAKKTGTAAKKTQSASPGSKSPSRTTESQPQPGAAGSTVETTGENRSAKPTGSGKQEEDEAS